MPVGTAKERVSRAEQTTPVTARLVHRSGRRERGWAAGRRRPRGGQPAQGAAERWTDYRPFLDRINDIAARADVSPIEFADRQSILLTNPGLAGRLQVTNTIRCAISVYNPGHRAPGHPH